MKHEELDLVMKAVVKIVNFVRANALITVSSERCYQSMKVITLI